MSTLPWFIDLTFQVPIQYHSLEHHTLLSPPDVSTTECPFHLDPASSFFLKLFLRFSAIVYWTPTDLGALIFWCCIILPFHTVHTFLKVRILEWHAIPFSSGPGFVRSLHQVIYLGWPYKAWLIASLSYTRLWSMWSLWLSFCHCGFCFGGCEIVVLLLVCLLMDEDKRFCKFPDVRAWLWGKLGLALGGRAMLRNPLIQLPADEWAELLPWATFLVGLRQPSTGIYWLYGEANGNLQKDLNQHTPPRTASASPSVLRAGHCWSTPSWETLKYSQAGLTQSFLGSWLLSLESLCTQGFVCALQESLSPLVLWKFFNRTLLSFKVRFPRDSQILCKIPRL